MSATNEEDKNTLPYRAAIISVIFAGVFLFAGWTLLSQSFRDHRVNDGVGLFLLGLYFYIGMMTSASVHASMVRGLKNSYASIITFQTIQAVLIGMVSLPFIGVNIEIAFSMIGVVTFVAGLGIVSGLVLLASGRHGHRTARQHTHIEGMSPIHIEYSVSRLLKLILCSYLLGTVTFVLLGLFYYYVEYHCSEFIRIFTMLCGLLVPPGVMALLQVKTTL